MKFLEVLKSGKKLDNSTFWKKAQNYLNLISACSSAIIIMLPQTRELLSPENISAFTVALAAINSYLNTATTDTIGLGTTQTTITTI